MRQMHIRVSCRDKSADLLALINRKIVEIFSSEMADCKLTLFEAPLLYSELKILELECHL